jgi:Na+/H+ antiporter NhaC
MKKKTKTIKIIIESIRLHKSFFYFLVTMFIWIVAIFLAIRMELKIPISLAITYVVFTLTVRFYLKNLQKKENANKFGYIIYTIMMFIFILFLIKDYVKK